MSYECLRAQVTWSVTLAKIWQKMAKMLFSNNIQIFSENGYCFESFVTAFNVTKSYFYICGIELS